MQGGPWPTVGGTNQIAASLKGGLGPPLAAELYFSGVLTIRSGRVGAGSAYLAKRARSIADQQRTVTGSTSDVSISSSGRFSASCVPNSVRNP